MVGINSIGAYVSDLTLIESHFISNRVDDFDALSPSVSIDIQKAGVQSGSDIVSVAAECTVDIEVLATPSQEAVFAGNMLIGCTISTNAAGISDELEGILLKYAAQVCVGHARTVALQHSQSSFLPEPLVIPPMEFDTAPSEA